MQQRCSPQVLQDLIAQTQGLAQQQTEHGDIDAMNAKGGSARIGQQMQADIALLRQLDDLLHHQRIRKSSRRLGACGQLRLYIIKNRDRAQKLRLYGQNSVAPDLRIAAMRLCRWRGVGERAIALCRLSFLHIAS